MGKLTDVEVRKAKADPARPVVLRDELGLYLEIAPKTGAKAWRLRTREGGKDTTKVIGYYPDMSLGEARRVRGEKRGNVTPAARPAPTFRAMAKEWHEANAPRWVPHHAAAVWGSLEVAAFPAFGDDPVDAIEAPAVLAMLRVIEDRGALHVAKKVKGYVSGVFGYALALNYAKSNPAASLAGLLKPRPAVRARPARTSLAEVRAMLAAGEGVPAHPATRLALRLSALTVLRPGEIRHTPWAELAGYEGPEAVWNIPAPRMKMTVAHAVPLPRQAVEVIAELQKLTGNTPWVFPALDNPRNCMSENAVNYLLNRAGYFGRQCAHGLRASFSSIMNELFPADRAVIDLMLAHSPKDKVEAAYNRALHFDRRRELAQIWADLLLEGRPPAAALLDLPRRASPAGAGQKAA